ncbi:MAG: methyltransferase domain-containing protein [Verrucomicrobiae bacterium]|nr:methyltransferase domain-containing protein [Verrucomicrobiae bacterium]
MPTAENYTPGYTQSASDFMARRSAQTHAAFLLPHLRSSSRLLDCGCGPGSVTCDFARLLPSGQVVGVDRETSQVERARSHAAGLRLTNVKFEVGSIYELPFPDASFDIVFAHAVFEHLASPAVALAEVSRVLVPGGLVALRSPDWGGFIVAPDTPGLQSALRRYIAIQTANGGDVHVGRKFPGLLRASGFASPSFSATYECYPSPPLIGEYLALRLVSAGALAEAEALREWSRHPDAIFAQAWCEILGNRNA